MELFQLRSPIAAPLVSHKTVSGSQNNLKSSEKKIKFHLVQHTFYLECFHRSTGARYLPFCCLERGGGGVSYIDGRFHFPPAAWPSLNLLHVCDPFG